MADHNETESPTEEQIAAVTAKLVQWSTMLSDQEQTALASILGAAVGADDTRGQIIIVGGLGLVQPEIVRSGILAGIRSDGAGRWSSSPYWATRVG